MFLKLFHLLFFTYYIKRVLADFEFQRHEILFELTIDPPTINAKSTLKLKVYCPYLTVRSSIFLDFQDDSYKRIKNYNKTCNIYDSDGNFADSYICHESSIQVWLKGIFNGENDHKVKWWTFEILEFDNSPIPTTYTVKIETTTDLMNDVADYYNVTFIGVELMNSTLTVTGDQCGGVGDYHFVIEGNLTQIQNGSIVVKFPYYNDEIQDSFFPEINDASISEDQKISIESIKGFNTPNILVQATQINLTNTFPSENFLNKDVEFTLKNIRLPPSLKPMTGIVVQFLNTNFSAYQFTKPLTVSCSIPNDVVSMSSSLSKPMINSNTFFLLNFKTRDFKPRGARVDLTFPSEIPISSTLITAISGISNAESTLQYQINGQVISISNMFSKTYSGKDTHSFRISSIPLPSTTKPTSPFGLTIYDSNEETKNLMYTYKGTFTINASPGSFNAVEIEQKDRTIKVETEIKVRLVNRDAFPSGTYLIIDLPDEMTATNRNKEVCSQDFSITTGIETLVECTIEDNKRIKLTNGFPNGLAKENEIIFYISQVTNYEFVTRSSTFKIYSYTSDNYQIDIQEDNIFVDFIEGELASVSVVPSSYENSVICKYTIDIKVKNKVTQNGHLSIQFPEEIQMQSSACKVILPDGSESTTCEIDNDDSNTLLINSFNGELIILPNNIVTVEVNEVQNSRSFKPSSTFSILTKTNDDYHIDKNYNDVIVTNNINKLIDILAITTNSVITGELTRIFFKFTNNNYLHQNDVINILFPPEIEIDNDAYVITANGQDNISLNLIVDSISKSDQGTLIKIILIFTDSSYIAPIGEELTIKVNNVKNPISVKPTSKFSFSITTSDNYKIEEYAKDINLIMQTPHQFVLSAVTPDLPSMNTMSDYLFEFTTFNPVPSTDLIVIIYPSEISIENNDCILEAGDDSSKSINPDATCDINHITRTITISNAFTTKSNLPSSLSVQFKIKNVQNTISGTTAKTSSFKLYLKDKDNYSKDQEENNLDIMFNCLYPCATCTDVNDYCTKCVWSSNTPYLLDGMCYATCPSGYSPNSLTKECIQCHESCDQCNIDTPSKCTKCKTNYPYFLSSTSQCLAKCPDGYYSDSNNLCQPCSASCETCQDTAETCTSCKTDNLLEYLYNGRCLNDCPNNTIKTGKVCYDCDQSCKTCELTVNTCTSCNSPLLLYNSKCIQRDECTSEDNRLQDIANNKCLDCQEGCKICGSAITECRECSNGYVLKDSKCLKQQTSCEEGKYLTTEKLCDLCDTSLCKGCISTSTTCISCQGSLLLQNNVCVQTCSEGYFPNSDNTECRRCDSTCDSCTSDNLCVSCINNLALMDGRCISGNECEKTDGYYLVSSNDKLFCKKCSLENCLKCSSETKCNLCTDNYFGYNGECVGICPAGYKKDDASRTCIKESVVLDASKLNLKHRFIYANPYDYYAILAIFALGGIAISVQKSYNIEMLFLASVIPFISVMYKVILVLLFTYSFYLGITELFYTFAVLLIANCLFNYVYTFIYCFYTIKDEEFLYWKSSHGCSYITYLIMMILFDYKIVRLYYSRVTHKDFFNAKFKNYKKVHSPYKFSAFLDMILIHITSISICVYIIIMYKSYSFIFYLSIYSIIISTLLAVCIIFDMILVPDLNLDFYNQKKPKPDILPNNINDKPMGISQRYDYENDGYNKFESPTKNNSNFEVNVPNKSVCKETPRSDTHREQSQFLQSPNNISKDNNDNLKRNLFNDISKYSPQQLSPKEDLEENKQNSENLISNYNKPNSPEKKNNIPIGGMAPFVSFGNNNNIDLSQAKDNKPKIKNFQLGENDKIEEENNSKSHEIKDFHEEISDDIINNSDCFVNSKIGESIHVDVENDNNDN